jgi:phosphonate transport system substrate-binding protein
VGRKELLFALTWQRNTAPIGAATTELLRWLGNEVGRPIIPRVAIAYEDILAQFGRGEIDLAWLPPIAFLRLRTQLRTLLVNQRHGERAFHAIVAVRSSSRHSALDKLQGARAAWIDPYSTTGYVLPLLDLASRGVDARTTFGEQRFCGSHDAAARAVFEGRSDLLGTFGQYEGDRLARAGFSSFGTASDWRVLLRGSESPSDVLAARIDLDVALCDAVKSALTRALANDETASLVRDLFHVDAFGEADDERYAALADTIERARADGLLPHL